MSMPVLYSPEETEFDSNGKGVLSDAVSCEVTEERNGIFELKMEYPVAGIHFEDIGLRSLVLAKPNPCDSPQPFRIYRITRPLGGVVSVCAEHISYDLAGVAVSPFKASDVQDAFIKLKQNSSVPHPFEFFTDKTTKGNMEVSVPSSLRSLLGGAEGSVLDVYGGGEYLFDGFKVSLLGQRGSDRGVSIRYGKNLTDITQDENCSNVYTGVYPYWRDSEGEILELPEKTLSAEGEYGFSRIMPLDLSSDWQEKPPVEELRRRALEYMKSNSIGVPNVSLEVSFVQLEQTEEYGDPALQERVALCDTVTVEFPSMGVSAKAKVTRTVYNVLLDRYSSVTIGEPKSSLADTLTEQSRETDKKIEDARTGMQKAVDRATQAITGNRGGYVVLHDSSGDGYPDELLVMDMPSVEEAVHVWRWNNEGLGYSDKGYSGPYGTAVTADGHIVADFVNAGSLSANVITTGILKSDDGVTFYLDLDSGELRMKASSLSISGKTVDEIAGSAAQSALDSAKSYADGAAEEALGTLSQEEILKRLTNSYADKGIYLEGGNLCINANMIHAGTLSGDYIKGGTLTLGGENDINGKIVILDASGQQAGTWSSGGISANGRIESQGRDSRILINSGVLRVYRGTGQDHLGELGPATEIDVGQSAQNTGLGFSMTDQSSFMTWKNSGKSFMTYYSGTGEMNLYCDLQMHSHSILNESDERLKTNIEPLKDTALDVLGKIGVYSYDWIKDGRHVQAGFIAQQIEENTGLDLTVSEGKEGYRSVKPLDLIPWLVKAVQELSGRLDRLEKKTRGDADFGGIFN